MTGPKWTAVLAAAAIAASTIGWTVDAQAQNKVRIGVIVPLSGPFALGGQNVKRGYDLAVEYLNAAGGIKALGGAQIELVYADNQGKQDVGDRRNRSPYTAGEGVGDHGL